MSHKKEQNLYAKSSSRIIFGIITIIVLVNAKVDGGGRQVAKLLARSLCHYGFDSNYALQNGPSRTF